MCIRDSKALIEKPEAVNTSPHESWMVALKILDPADQRDLLDAAQYADLTK